MLKNITLSAEEHLIAAARARAAREHTTLNAEFREWLEEFGEEVTPEDEHAKQLRARDYHALMERIRKNFIGPGRKLTREELNER